MSRIRYNLPEAAEKLGCSLGQLCERIAREEIVPKVYPGDIEIGDGEWMPAAWTPVLNPERFAKLAGLPDERIRVRFKSVWPNDHVEEEKNVRLAKLTISAHALARVACDAGEASSATFEHAENYSWATVEGRKHSFDPRQAKLLRRFVENHQATKGMPIKSNDLRKGIADTPDDRITKIFPKEHSSWLSNGGFIFSPKKGYYALAISAHTSFLPR